MPPRIVLPTEHCVVPCYLFLRAGSLSVACDIRGLTEHQPVAREDSALLSGREAQRLWGRGQAKRDHLARAALTRSSRARSENER